MTVNHPTACLPLARALDILIRSKILPAIKMEHPHVPVLQYLLHLIDGNRHFPPSVYLLNEPDIIIILCAYSVVPGLCPQGNGLRQNNDVIIEVELVALHLIRHIQYLLVMRLLLVLLPEYYPRAVGEYLVSMATVQLLRQPP